MNVAIETKYPGMILQEELLHQSMSQKELALRTGVTEKHISTVINGLKNISPSFARKLDIALGSKKGYWQEIQAQYDQQQIEYEEENGITQNELDILTRLKDIIDYFIHKGILFNNCGKAQKVIQLRSVLRVNNLMSIEKISYNASYRAQIKKCTNIDRYVLFAWQRLCEINTENIDVKNSFDRDKLCQSIEDIKNVMFMQDINDGICRLKEIFLECGVAFDVVRHFHGAPVQGFIKETDCGKIILCLTIRGKKADRFWFSLFHEVGHLLNGDYNIRFVDFSSVKNENEEKADLFARNILISPDKYRLFIESGKYTNLLAIKQFSVDVHIPYWIVIGRLHNDEWLDWSTFNDEIPSYSWVDEF